MRALLVQAGSLRRRAVAAGFATSGKSSARPSAPVGVSRYLQPGRAAALRTGSRSVGQSRPRGRAPAAPRRRVVHEREGARGEGQRGDVRPGLAGPLAVELDLPEAMPPTRPETVTGPRSPLSVASMITFVVSRLGERYQVSPAAPPSSTSRPPRGASARPASQPSSSTWLCSVDDRPRPEVLLAGEADVVRADPLVCRNLCARASQREPRRQGPVENEDGVADLPARHEA